MSKTIILNLPVLMRTANGDTGPTPLNWGNAEKLAVDIGVTGSQGTSPTLQVFVDRLGSDGSSYFAVYDSTALAPGSYPRSTSIGPGCTNPQEIAQYGRVRWVIGGSATPGVQFTVSIQGE
jgi:hypothetical protein